MKKENIGYALACMTIGGIATITGVPIVFNDEERHESIGRYMWRKAKGYSTIWCGCFILGIGIALAKEK